MRVFLAIPTYNGWVHSETMRTAFCGATRRGPHDVQLATKSGSLLGHTFNQLTVDAVGAGCGAMLMLHADVSVAEPDWLPLLMEQLESSGADVLSVPVRFKDNSCLVSTAVLDEAGNQRCLHLDELAALPKTFTAGDFPGTQRLLVNTGCMVLRLDRPWLKQWRGFEVRTHINWDTPALSCGVGEDYGLSLDIAALGGVVACTSAVHTTHHGEAAYPTPPGYV